MRYAVSGKADTAPGGFLVPPGFTVRSIRMNKTSDRAL
jgi:hypothetical protein